MAYIWSSILFLLLASSLSSAVLLQHNNNPGNLFQTPDPTHSTENQYQSSGANGQNFFGHGSGFNWSPPPVTCPACTQNVVSADDLLKVVTQIIEDIPNICLSRIKICGSCPGIHHPTHGHGHGHDGVPNQGAKAAEWVLRSLDATLDENIFDDNLNSTETGEDGNSTDSSEPTKNRRRRSAEEYPQAPYYPSYTYPNPPNYPYYQPTYTSYYQPSYPSYGYNNYYAQASTHKFKSDSYGYEPIIHLDPNHPGVQSFKEYMRYKTYAVQKDRPTIHIN